MNVFQPRFKSRSLTHNMPEVVPPCFRGTRSVELKCKSIVGMVVVAMVLVETVFVV